MANQRLHALEKTSIQARHSIKRLEMFIETTKDEQERGIAEELLGHFETIRQVIPKEYRDVDIRENN